MTISKQSTGISTITRKFIMALSGIALVLFVIVHLIENLTLYSPSGDAFNHYVFFLHSFGSLLYIAEIGLLLVFVAHILLGFTLKATNSSARPKGYKKWRTKGGGTPSNLSSRNMVITGTLLLIFLIIHVKMFRFGPGIADGYSTQINGQDALDLHRVVVENFKNPYIAGGYVFAMLMLGMHFRHGFWSAFQSLGVAEGRLSCMLRCLGGALAVLLAVGFLFIPVYIYFFV